MLDELGHVALTHHAQRNGGRAVWRRRQPPASDPLLMDFQLMHRTLIRNSTPLNSSAPSSSARTPGSLHGLQKGIRSRPAFRAYRAYDDSAHVLAGHCHQDVRACATPRHGCNRSPAAVICLPVPMARSSAVPQMARHAHLSPAAVGRQRAPVCAALASPSLSDQLFARDLLLERSRGGLLWR